MELTKLQLIFISGLLLAGISTIYVFHMRNEGNLSRQAMLDDLLDVYYYSKASYCDSASIQSWSCGDECKYHPFMTQVQSFYDKPKEAQGYCAYNRENKNIVVAFRGTDNIKNWVSDFSAVPVNFEECANCKIHLGFRNTLNAIQDGIVACVTTLQKQYPEAPIIVTGHSLGGALATLQAAQLKKIFSKSLVKLVTFGSPRVGNTEFSNYMNDLLGNNSYRVVNQKDIVPHVPLKTLMGFLHTGNELWLNDKTDLMHYKDCTNIYGEDTTCSSSVLAILYSVKDHLSYFGFYTGCGTQVKYEEEMNGISY